MRNAYDKIVVAGGFRSMVAAYAWAKAGHSVLLIEALDKLGGFMSPIRWGDFWIDKGPQFFDNFEEHDRAYFEEMLGENLLESIGFAYASYMNGTKTDRFAIPDWRTRGSEFVNAAFGDLFARRIAEPEPQQPLANASDVIARDGGPMLQDDLTTLTKKFLRHSPENLGVPACQMITIFGRKLFFDQDVSIDLKQSPILDGLLAAEKATNGETRYNLYPRGTSLETVRLAMEKALDRVGVDVAVKAPLEQMDAQQKCCTIAGQTVSYGQIFFGGDCRDAERQLLGTEDLRQNTHLLPEIFHCFVVPTAHVDAAYYTMDYDPDHLSTRMTNFCNYMDARDADGNGVVCIEQPVDRDTDDWNDPARNLDRIFQEARDVGNITCDSYITAKSFAIPVTYKVPLAGFVDAWSDVKARTRDAYGDDVILPDATTLTRKQTLDDLRQIGILS